MVYNRYFCQQPHIKLRLDFIKLRGQIIPGLDEAAKAMFRANERMIATRYNPAGDHVHKEVDVDLYRLEKACWEIICKSLCDYYNFRGPH